MFDDLNNSNHYKECLLKAYQAGNTNFWKSIPENLPSEEKFDCPALDNFLKRYGYDLDDYCKADIYLTTGYWIEWYRKCTTNSILPPESFRDPMLDSICGWIVTENQLDLMQKSTLYRRMKAAGIPGFPKTFNTFRKHYENYSDKYKEWEKYYNANNSIDS